MYMFKTEFLKEIELTFRGFQLKVGADAKKVSEGLMSESRIGSNLPLRAGSWFLCRTLGRDLKILIKLGQKPDMV